MTSTQLVYDAAAVSRILGLRCECSDPAPEARDGEIVVYYGGWDLPELSASIGSKNRMPHDVWYEKPWRAEPGYYRLLLPVPNSNWKTWDEQLKLLDSGWQPAPVCVATTAFLAHRTKTSINLLEAASVENDGWCRCAEAPKSGRRVTLGIQKGRVEIHNDWDDRGLGWLWLCAARKA